MPSSVNVQTRVDPTIKEEASLVLQSIGLSISDVMRVMLTRIAQDRAVPFELFRPNETTMAAMREARDGKNLKRFSSVAEMMADEDEDDRDDDAVSEGSEARTTRAASGKGRRRPSTGA